MLGEQSQQIYVMIRLESIRTRIPVEEISKHCLDITSSHRSHGYPNISFEFLSSSLNIQDWLHLISRRLAEKSSPHLFNIFY